MSVDLLHPESLPLRGVHLIEASAGTGKTYNITRLYLRLLLQRRLGVDAILVMTFTRAATGELRKRIGDELRRALNHWDELVASEPFYRALAAKLPDDGDNEPQEAARTRLRNALLLLDEAPIHTIHGFCRQALTQRAFDSGIAFNVEMESDTGELALEATRDAYRRLARQDADAYRELSARWPTPEDFHAEFGVLIQHHAPLIGTDPDALRANLLREKRALKQNLEQHQAGILAALVENHKQREQRRREWAALLAWLEDERLEPIPKDASAFFNGNRTRRQAGIHALFEPLRRLHQRMKAGGPVEKQLTEARLSRIVLPQLEWIRHQFDAAKQRQRLMGFDDLVERLADCLRDARGDRLVHHLRKQYPVALVDEFQDTDPQQYAILRALYHHGGDTALYMIGDPKQAIYAFRGGDIFAYLEARENADTQWFMDTNWRSSTAMVEAGNRLFAGAGEDDRLGPGIRYRPVKPSPRADAERLEDPANPAALCLAWLPDEEQAGGVNQDHRARIAAWCAGEVDRLLREARIDGKPLRAADIALLVRDSGEAEQIRQALRDAGHASVYLSIRDQVFASEEARDLLRALNGILHHDEPRLFTAALATPFLGLDSHELHALRNDDARFEACQNRLIALHEAWHRRGFIAMAMDLLHQNGRPPPHRHERALTNAIHLFELLQQASQRHPQPEQLLGWFHDQVHADSAPAEAELRLESDARLIRVITQHGAKGLEYPVVFVPFPTRYRDPLKLGSRRRFSLSCHDPQSRRPCHRLAPDDETRALAREEAEAESARLLYVAVTRARHRCYLCAAPFREHARSPLGRILGLEDGDPGGNALRAALEALDDGRTTRFNEIAPRAPIAPAPCASEPPAPVEAARFRGRIRHDWWLSSFSALTRDLRHGGVTPADRDENDNGAPAPQADALRFAMPRGIDTGNLLHSILETLDFTRPDWPMRLRGPLYRFGALPNGYNENDLAQWLDECLRAPLGDGLRLADLTPTDTLRETGFYFPMDAVRREALAALLGAHRGESARLPGPQRLEGMLQGYIDLVYRWRGRYYLADYKSTHLGERLADYHHEALWNNVRDNYYDLQYLLYALALHRHLRARLPDYDPTRHFGGVRYLYLRGMHPDGPDGVLSVSLEAELLEELDALFAGGAPIAPSATETTR